MMPPGDRLLFAVVRGEFAAEPGDLAAAAALSAVEWPRAIATADRHGVGPLLALRLGELAPGIVPGAVRERLELVRFEGMARAARDAERLRRAVGRLYSVGWEALLIKGTAMAVAHYRPPWLATSNDLDLVLRPGPGGLDADERGVRRELYRSGVECDVGGHHDLDSNRALRLGAEVLWDGATRVDLGGVAAHLPSTPVLLLASCLNACRKRYFRLKALLDVGLLAAAGAADGPRLPALARAVDAAPIVWAALWAARRAVGAAVSDRTLDALGVARWRQALLRRAGGHFLHHGRLDTVVGGYGRALDCSLLLVYASYGPLQLVRSWRHTLAHAGGWHRRRAAEAQAVATHEP